MHTRQRYVQIARKLLEAKSSEKKDYRPSKDVGCRQLYRVGGFDQSDESLSYLNLNCRQPICHFSPVYKKFASHQSFPITTIVTRNIIHFQTYEISLLKMKPPYFFIVPDMIIRRLKEQIITNLKPHLRWM